MIHHELPVYRSAYAFLLSMFQLCRGFDREYKFTWGENIKKDGLELLQLVYLACVRAENSDLLLQARERLELIRLQMRLLMDLKQISLFIGRGSGLVRVIFKPLAYLHLHYVRKIQNLS
jgi:hypothetical protein